MSHNWSNAVNLVMLYTSMCDKVNEVEEALEDVREMMMKGMKVARRSLVLLCKMLSSRTLAGSAYHSFFDHGLVSSLTFYYYTSSWLAFWRMDFHILQSILPSSNSASLNQVRTQPHHSAPTDIRITSLLLLPPSQSHLPPSDHLSTSYSITCATAVQILWKEIGWSLWVRSKWLLMM